MESFVLRNAKELDNYLSWLKGQRLPLRIISQFIDRQRTLDQNAYLWGVVYKEIADYTGHTVDEVHEHFKTKKNVEYSFNPRTMMFELRVKSTTEFEVMDMGEYIDFICSEAIDLGIRISEANEQFTNDDLSFKKCTSV
jgi:hypothetical protein